MNKNVQEKDKLKRRLDNKRDEHNKLINEKCLFFDKYFLGLLNIKDGEEKLISRMLKNKKIFISENL